MQTHSHADATNTHPRGHGERFVCAPRRPGRRAPSASVSAMACLSEPRPLFASMFPSPTLLLFPRSPPRLVHPRNLSFRRLEFCVCVC
eukprot:4895861-Prymnesium_polylepis.1